MLDIEYRYISIRVKQIKHISYLYTHIHIRQKAPRAMLRSMQPETTNKE